MAADSVGNNFRERSVTKTMKAKIILTLLCSLLVVPVWAQKTAGQLSGELQQWHRVTITFHDSGTSETATPNPFRDYRLNVTFTNGNRNFVVPGFYADDGNAGESSATSGNKWRVHFMPDAVGEWRYVASFRSGSDVVLSAAATAGKAAAFDGASGTFTVAASNKSGADFRGKGGLRYVGKHYLQFAGTGEYFISARIRCADGLDDQALCTGKS